MSIFAADIKRRTSDEDRLISRFFGTMGIADRDRVLGGVLSGIGVDVARSDLSGMRVEFWQPYFRATPSVLLEGESALVFVETPRDLAAARESLLTEVAEGLKGSSHFAMVLVTSHQSEPPEIAALRAEVVGRNKTARLVWTSWTRLYKLIHAIGNADGVDDVSRRLIGDLLAFMDELGLSGFVGFPRESYQAAITAHENLRGFTGRTRSLVAELSAAVEDDGVSPVALGEAPAAFADPLRAPDWLVFSYRDDSWESVEISRCHIYVKAYLDAPIFWVGYRIDLGDPSRRAFLIEKRATLASVLESRPGSLLVLQSGEGRSGILRSVKAGEGGLGFLESRDALAGVEHADVVLPVDEEELASADLPLTLRERILWLRDCVGESALYPAPDTEPSRRFVVTNF